MIYLMGIFVLILPANDINAEYTEVLQTQLQNYEPLNTYAYGVQRITNEKANDTITYYQYDVSVK